jgi:hypothetical protein
VGETTEDPISRKVRIIIFLFTYQTGIGFKPVLCSPGRGKKVLNTFLNGGRFGLRHLAKRKVFTIFANKELESCERHFF